jgi:hypothetical protein
MSRWRLRRQAELSDRLKEIRGRVQRARLAAEEHAHLATILDEVECVTTKAVSGDALGIELDLALDHLEMVVIRICRAAQRAETLRKAQRGLWTLR